MPKSVDRRGFMKKTLLASGGITAGLTFEHHPLLAQLQAAGGKPIKSQAAAAPPPMSQIGKLKVTRLLCGGNLFSGFAHSGDLLYVSNVLKHYFVPDKILDTLQLCEESGINSCILRTDDHIVDILKRYRKERGGKLQWIAQTYPTIDNLKDNIKLAIDNGAVAAYAMGGNADTFFQKGRGELIGEVVAFIKQNGLVAGIGSHSLEVPKLAEQQRFNPDFYFKTINAAGYETQEPAEIAAFMKTVKKPWIAFKVLGAGRMKAQDGIDLAFKSGADFVNVGMYDFQVREDVALVRDIVAKHSQRERAWSA
jgi:hypothetical protein